MQLSDMNFHLQYLAFILTLFIWRQVKLKTFEVYPVKATIASINLQIHIFFLKKINFLKNITMIKDFRFLIRFRWYGLPWILSEFYYFDACLTTVLTIHQCKMSCKYKALSKSAAHMQFYALGSCQFNTNILARITESREDKYPFRDKFSWSQ